jgi:hypothetical protein
MPHPSKVLVAGLLGLSLLGAGCAVSWPWSKPAAPAPVTSQATSTPPVEIPPGSSASSSFGASVVYQTPTTTINPAIAKDFDVKTITNLADMEKAYGFKFTPPEMQLLSQNKFVVKNVLDTNLKPYSDASAREFVDLYQLVQGERDVHVRGPQNSMFFSSDVFFNAYNNLYVELLKEMENKTFYPNIKSLSQTFYEGAKKHLAEATTDADKKKWMKVRNYFAVPYAIFQTAALPPGSGDYQTPSGEYRNPNDVMKSFLANDATVDTYDHAAEFVKTLKLDADSEQAVLADLKQIYDPSDSEVPNVFADEYKAYAAQEKVLFKVDFTQFTPRGTYTSTSLRREYFRGMKWYIMVPFFLKSADLTSYSFAISQLMAENPKPLKDYSQLEEAIGFMVGSSDDLMPVDYLKALQSAKGSSDETQAAMDYLIAAHNPLIKDLKANYQDVGTVSSSAVLLKTKGMRFFSGKFIMDSYWTGQLTQGDEAVKPGYPAKLPPMASSLEVMTLLGSDYAQSQLPKLDFYTPKYSQAVDKGLADLEAENAKMTQGDWTKNLYTSWLWTIQGLFGWLKTNHDSLPRFMQSTAWEAKTLQTAAVFWTELRHATILYAKQSFAEMGGGGPACDPRTVPPPPKGYIEPQLEAYARLSYLAKRTYAGLNEQGFVLDNMAQLNNFIELMDKVQGYTQKELGNATLNEHITKVTGQDPNDPTKKCTEYHVDDGSDWEALRLQIISGLKGSVPTPVEGPVTSAKDQRAAIVADVHTGGDSDNPTKILYEGEGVPYVIFTAVSDANGPRLTVGFISSQYEFTKDYGGKRLTDEDWQSNFYVGNDDANPFQYTDVKTWPAINPWYAPLFGGK